MKNYKKYTYILLVIMFLFSSVLVGFDVPHLPVANAQVQSTTLTVKKDGTGNYTTVQACADAVQPGQTCLVYPGTYSEYVVTKTNGTSESQRISFKASGTATVQGFYIKHAYTTVEGFDITGYTSQYSGSFLVGSSGNYCKILNNTIRDGSLNVQGMILDPGNKGCVVSGNTLRNLRYMFTTIYGEGHLFESNVFEKLNNMDYLRVFGHDHVFRRNIFRDGNSISGEGNHADFVQTFGNNGVESYNMLFEENWIQDLSGQLGQLNNNLGSLTPETPLAFHSNIRDWVFKNNIFINTIYNMNVGMPGVQFLHNTFYKTGTELSGISIGGNLRRGDPSRATLKNNVFLAGGKMPDPYGYRGYYGMSGAELTKEVTATINKTSTTGDAIFNDLVANGYINGNGVLQSKIKALTNASELVLGGAYEQYRSQIYDLANRTVLLNTQIVSTFSADYNYVAEAAPTYALKNSNCAATDTLPRFCEAHGINGGDPLLQNINNVLGADGKPFTLDDGLKPRPDSILCGKGENGKDIGVYSCSTSVVFANSTSTTLFPSPTPVPPPPQPQPVPTPVPQPSPVPTPNPTAPGSGGSPTVTVKPEQFPNGTIFKYANSPTVYIKENDKARPITDFTVYQNQVPSTRNIITIPSSVTFPQGDLVGLRSGTLIKSSDSPTVYLIVDGKKFTFSSEQQFKNYSYDFANVRTINDPALVKSLPVHDGGFARPRGTLFKYANSPTVYFLTADKKKMGFTTLSMYNLWVASPKDVVTIPDTEAYHDGSIVTLPNGILVKGSAPTIYFTVDGKLKPFTNTDLFNAMGLSFSQVHTIPDSDISLHSIGGNME